MSASARLAPLFLPVALLMGALAAACGDDLGTSPGNPGGSAGNGGGGSGSGSVTSGAMLYKQHCASCHGPAGEGGSGKKLKGWSKGQKELVSIIEQRMPPQDPKTCQGQCATDVAAYILANFKAEPVVCKGDELPPRRLRLLTRREYNATVRDLLRLGGTPAGASCSADADCNVSSESCVAGSCQQDPCNVRTFTFAAQGKAYKSVHVAGSFNGWPGTVAAGGWAMTYLPGKDLYVAKKSVADGNYSYKFVLDEGTWIADPGNPKSEPDGFGAQNSLLTVSCAGASPPGSGAPSVELELAKSFPVESRPKGYSYDNNADAGLVTSIHVEQYLKASSQVAKLALGNAAKVVPCGDVTQAACRGSFLQDFGRRAFRRPLTPQEFARYDQLAQKQPSHELAVEAVVRAMVLSPFFLYRSELGTTQADGSFKLSPHEVATALSYTFWGTMPDDELAAAADAGALDPAGIEKQARRLLDSPLARAHLGVFSQQWLGIESVAELTRSNTLYPGWSAAVGAAMAEETRRFVEDVLFDGSHRLDDLLVSDSSFVDAQLAQVYGVSVQGSGFSKVQLPPERRAGLLGQGSVLASTSHSDQSSPIRRGLFVRERLLCQDLGQPPPNAGGVPEVDPNATTRERFRQHSSDPFCKSCHQYIDEVGFGMERFDAIGRYRTEENGQAIPTDGDMNDVEGLGTGTKGVYNALPELASIVAKSDAFHQCFTRQAYRYAHGALEQDQDLCALASLASSFEQSGGDVRELLVAITRSPGFAARR